MRQIGHVLENCCAQLALAWSRELEVVVPVIQGEWDVPAEMVGDDDVCSLHGERIGERFCNKIMGHR